MFDRSLNTPLKHCVNHWNKSILLRLYELRRSRMNQVKFFTGCLLQILLCPMLNTLNHINQATKKNLLKYKNTSYIIKVNPSDKRFWRTSLKACAIFFIFFFHFMLFYLFYYFIIYIFYFYEHIIWKVSTTTWKKKLQKISLKLILAVPVGFVGLLYEKWPLNARTFFSLPQSKQRTGDPR